MLRQEAKTQGGNFWHFALAVMEPSPRLCMGSILHQIRRPAESFPSVRLHRSWELLSGFSPSHFCCEVLINNSVARSNIHFTVLQIFESLNSCARCLCAARDL